MVGVPFGHKDSVGSFPNHLAFPYDIVDKRTEYVITADIPGANRDMVEVSVDEDRVLHIVDERADRHEERGGSDEDGAKYVVYNRSFGRFRAQLSAAGGCRGRRGGRDDETRRAHRASAQEEGDHPAGAEEERAAHRGQGVRRAAR